MGNVEMIVWDVQHGNAIYVKTPNGRHLVFDLGKGDYSGKNPAFSPLGALWHNYNVKKLDYVMITHPHRDHIDEILYFDSFAPTVFGRPWNLTRENVMKDVSDTDKPKFEKYFELHQRYNGNPVGTPNDTLVPANYGGLKFQYFQTPTLPKDNINNHSYITVLEYEGIKVVIPGDNEIPSLDLLMQQETFKNAVKDCDILIAPHHGRQSAYHNWFVSHANPRLTIISDGSICDTSANPKYSAASRGWKVWKKGTNNGTERKLLTTNSDGEVFISFGPHNTPEFKTFLKVEVA